MDPFADFRPVSARRSLGTAALLLSLGFLGACGGGEPESSSSPADRPTTEAPSADAEEAQPAPSSGIPEGGLERWVSDIRSELDAIASADVAGARDQVMNLYVGRQEYIEMFYGRGGRISGRDHPELGQAIETQEGLFHELMQLTGQEEPDPDRVRETIDELRVQLDRVLELAREAGVPMDRDDAGAGPPPS